MAPHASASELESSFKSQMDTLRKTLKELPPVNEDGSVRPSTVRRSTEPASPTQVTPKLSALSLGPHPRNRSPYTRTHNRSRSSTPSLTPPTVMARAHSSPIVDAFGHVHLATGARPASPLTSTTVRRQSPLRRPLDFDAPFSSFNSNLDIDQTISENQELDLSTKTLRPGGEEQTPNTPYNNHTFPRTRRRPASPLLNAIPSPIQGSGFYSPTTPTTPRSKLHTSTSSPSLNSAKYNEAYPSLTPASPHSPRLSHSHSFSSSSSFPGTPTSFRSRSPSISSLETIPDTPDAEIEAQEAESVARIARLKAAMERERDGEKSKADGGVVMRGRSTEKRKRWSVCGAERRGDLDLETIWED